MVVGGEHKETQVREWGLGVGGEHKETQRRKKCFSFTRRHSGEKKFFCRKEKERG